MRLLPRSAADRGQGPPEPVVVTTRAELVEIVEAAVRRALDERQPEVEWLDTRGAADRLGVHPRTVLRLARSGALQGTRVGKLWRFRARDVDEFAAG